MKIEDFIKRHRNEFDDKEPPSRSWEVVESSIPVPPKASLWNSVGLWRAAAIVFMTLSVVLLFPKEDYFSDQTATALNEFQDVEKFYNQQISYKVSLINNFKRGDGLNGFTQDFHQLEAMYNVLKEEMRTHPSEKVKDALVLNLLVRIDLLNQRLHKLESEQKREAENSIDAERGT